MCTIFFTPYEVWLDSWHKDIQTEKRERLRCWEDQASMNGLKSTAELTEFTQITRNTASPPLQAVHHSRQPFQGNSLHSCWVHCEAAPTALILTTINTSATKAGQSIIACLSISGSQCTQTGSSSKLLLHPPTVICNPALTHYDQWRGSHAPVLLSAHA